MKTKYVLIDRGEGYKNTAVTTNVAKHMIETGKATNYKPVTFIEIKANRIHIYKEECYWRHINEDALIKKYDGKKFKAKISCFDSGWTKAYVHILDTDLSILPIYACNIVGKKTWYPETACVYYENNQIIEVELKVYSGGKIFVCGLTPGILDEERWNKIKNDSLAFRCNDKGEIITGLFK